MPKSFQTNYVANGNTSKLFYAYQIDTFLGFRNPDFGTIFLLPFLRAFPYVLIITFSFFIRDGFVGS